MHWLIPALEAIRGWTWDPRTESKRRNLLELRGHVVRHGWDTLDEHTVTRTGKKIGQWTNNIRAEYRRGALAGWLVAGMESIPGWTWQPRRARQEAKVARLARYVAEHGWESVTEMLVVRGDRIGTWVSYCRACYRKGILPRETVAGLEVIAGWSWTARTSWPRTKNKSGRFTGRRPRT
ncbi:MAG: helicase associated domain-containing protein [Kofleriaceae bacterium]